MIKKALFVLMMLLSAILVQADLPRCACVYCSTHTNDLCKTPSGTVRVCFEYLDRCAP